ncbi:hypothetical protein D3C72_2484540 [compost metagenome]
MEALQVRLTLVSVLLGDAKLAGVLGAVVSAGAAFVVTLSTPLAADKLLAASFAFTVKL